MVSFLIKVDLFLLESFSSNIGMIFFVFFYVYSVLMFVIDYRLPCQSVCFLIFFYLHSNFFLFSILLSFSHKQKFYKYFLDEKTVSHFAIVLTFNRFLLLNAILVSINLLAEWSKGLDTTQDIQKSRELLSKMYDQCNDCAPSEILEKSEKYLKAQSQILSKKSFSIFQELGIKLYKMIN